MIFLNNQNKVFKSTFDLEILCHLQKTVEIILSDTHLPMIHKVQDRKKICVLYVPQVEKRMGVGVLFQDASEERRTWSQYYFVGLDLLLLASQGHVKEVFVFSQLPECDAYVCLKVVPSQAKLLARHLFQLLLGNPLLDLGFTFLGQFFFFLFNWSESSGFQSSSSSKRFEFLSLKQDLCLSLFFFNDTKCWGRCSL